jgi:hypothetical protein
VRLIRLVVSLLAVCAAIVFGLRGRRSWPGHVSDEQGTALPGATALLLENGRVLAQTTTDATGDFKLPISTDGDTALHVVVCKAGREPNVIQSMSPQTSKNRRPQSFTLLLPARADFEAPYIASLKAVLPQECR